MKKSRKSKISRNTPFSKFIRKFKEYLYIALTLIALLSLLVVFKCQPHGRYGGSNRTAKRAIAKANAKYIESIESVKNPVYTIQGKGRTIEIPMEVTDKGKLLSVLLNGTKVGFELSSENTEFTVSPQGVLKWYEEGLLTVEEIGGKEIIRELYEDKTSDSLSIRLRHVQIGNNMLPAVEAKVVKGQEFPYRMGSKTWNILLSAPSKQ